MDKDMVEEKDKSVEWRERGQGQVNRSGRRRGRKGGKKKEGREKEEKGKEKEEGRGKYKHRTILG